MAYRHINNLYKDKTVLMFKRLYALEKIHGTSAHLSFKTNREGYSLGYFSGGENYEKFCQLFNQEDLLEKANNLQFNQDFTVYGEAYGGCLNWRTPILLANGKTMQIGDIVNKKLKVDVLTYNLQTNRLESKKIIGWSRTPNKNNWKTIYVEKRLRGGKSTRIIVTDNHLFFVKEEDRIISKYCKDLKINDIVLLPGEKLSNIQEDLIRGSLLGDGSITHTVKTRSYKFAVSHSLKQNEYLNLKKQILNSIICSDEEYRSGFNSLCRKLVTKSLPDIKNIYQELYKRNKKSVNTFFLNKLTPLSLAIWYMDDGSLVINNNGRHSLTCMLATQGFSKNEQIIIIKWFKKRNISCYRVKSGKFYTIKFTPNGTKKFHFLISPYIIKDMKYKIIPEYRQIDNTLNANIFEQANYNLIESKINKIKTGNPYSQPCYNERFDIEVEDNHNFFANKVLVHNSQQGMSKTYGPDLKFVAFEVQIGEKFVDVPFAETVVKKLGLEFVHYEEIDADPEVIDKLAWSPSVQAQRNGVENPELPREGVVLRPLREFLHPDGVGRIMAKHKNDKYREREHAPKIKNPEDLKILEDARRIADEWVVMMRLEHVLDRLRGEGIECDEKQMNKIINAMIEDVYREAKGEIVESKEVRKQIGKRTAKLIIEKLKGQING